MKKIIKNLVRFMVFAIMSTAIVACTEDPDGPDNDGNNGNGSQTENNSGSENNNGNTGGDNNQNADLLNLLLGRWVVEVDNAEEISEGEEVYFMPAGKIIVDGEIGQYTLNGNTLVVGFHYEDENEYKTSIASGTITIDQNYLIYEFTWKFEWNEEGVYGSETIHGNSLVLSRVE